MVKSAVNISVPCEVGTVGCVIVTCSEAQSTGTNGWGLFRYCTKC